MKKLSKCFNFYLREHMLAWHTLDIQLFTFINRKELTLLCLCCVKYDLAILF